VNEEREPGLQAQVQPTKARVLDIKVELQALAQLQAGLQHFGLVVAPHLIRPARLDAAEDRHQALFNGIAPDNVLRLFFFGEGAASQVGEPIRRN
jgi:hypothetical protein